MQPRTYGKDRSEPISAISIEELRGEISLTSEVLADVKADRDGNALAWNHFRQKEEQETAEKHAKRHEVLSQAVASWEKRLAYEQRRLAYLEAGGEPDDPFWDD